MKKPKIRYKITFKSKKKKNNLLGKTGGEGVKIDVQDVVVESDRGEGDNQNTEVILK
ncbi:MAG: hypothetical protein PHX72_03160 [Candidatus Shapirobacteria bacterium]|nr:hypothetical protein [Candidatus Shapirobacteria bacterium]